MVKELIHAVVVLPARGVRETWTLVARTRAAGWNSGRAYARTTLTNYYIRIRNRLVRRPRAACPCCGWSGYGFLMIDCGYFVVPEAECPHCGCHERHRMLHLYLYREQPGFFSARGRVLHVAPEHQVRELLLRNPDLFCLSTDYPRQPPNGFPGTMILTDLQRLAIADNTFDFVFCLHVLEHVADDRQGITEMWRILKPGGVAYLMVPFMLGWEKTVEFGKPDPMMFDHVRGYSPNDFHDRLKPFRYEEIFPENFLTPDEVQQYRIPRDSQVIYRCEKQPEEGSSGKRSDPSR